MHRYDDELIGEEAAQLVLALLEREDVDVSAVLELLVLALHDDRDIVVDRAVEMLVWLAPDSVDALVAELDKGSNPAVAAYVLGSIGDPRTLPALMMGLRHTDAKVRKECAAALAELQDPAAVQPLLRATRDPDHAVRTQAALALDGLGSAAVIVGVAALMEPMVEEAVRTAIERADKRGRAAARSRRDHPRGAALDIGPTAGLHRHRNNSGRPKGAACHSRKSVRERRLTLISCREDAKAEHQIARPPARHLGVDRRVGLLRRPRRTHPRMAPIRAAECELRRFSRSGRSITMRAEQAVRAALARSPMTASAVRPCVCSMRARTESPSPRNSGRCPAEGEARELAILALADLKDSMSAAVLAAALAQGAGDDLLDEPVGRLLVAQIEKDEPGAQQAAIRRLVEVLGDERGIVVDRAAELLVRLAPVSVDALVAALGSSTTAADAAYVLGMIRDRQTIGPLLDALRNDDPRVRRECAAALGGFEAREAVMPLVRATHDLDHGVRVQAATALERMGASSVIIAVEALLQPMIHDAVRSARSAAAAAQAARRPLVGLQTASKVRKKPGDPAVGRVRGKTRRS